MPAPRSESIDNMLMQALVTLLDPSRPDVHWHFCKNKACGHTWQHDRAKIPKGEGEYEKAHTCPKCQASVCFTKCQTEQEAQLKAAA